MQKKVLIILFITLLIDMIGIGMVIPILPIIFTDPSSPSFLLHGFSQSAQYIFIGVITALFGLMTFISAPILGELSDVYGRKRLLTIGVAVLAVSQMLFGLGVEIGSLWLLFISRIVAGLAGGNFSIAQASIADITEPKDRAKNFGLIGGAFGIGFILGPLLGGWIAHIANDASAPFWLAGVLGICNLFFISMFLPETNVNKAEAKSFHILKGVHNIKAALADAQARPVYISSFLYVSGFVFYTSFVGILLVNHFGLTEASIGTFFGVIGIWIAFTQLVILRILSKKYNERQILRYSLICLATAFIVYPFAPSVIFLYMLIPFLAIPNGLTMANMGALVSKSVSSHKQGAALGINGSLMAFSQGIIPLFAGVGSGIIGIKAPFFAGAILVMSAWYILFVRLK